MEYKAQVVSEVKIAPRLIIHGGAGNISRPTSGDDKYADYRDALLAIVCTHIVKSSYITFAANCWIGYKDGGVYERRR